MTPGEIIAVIATAAVICGAVIYIIISKKKGKKCIGCPYADSCKGGCSKKK